MGFFIFGTILVNLVYFQILDLSYIIFLFFVSVVNNKICDYSHAILSFRINTPTYTFDLEQIQVSLFTKVGKNMTKKDGEL